MWSLNGPLLFVVCCCSWCLTNYCNTVVTDNVCYHGCKHGSSLYCSTSCRFGTVTPYWLLINQKKVLNKCQTTVCIIIAIIICIISEAIVFSLANKRIFKIRQRKTANIPKIFSEDLLRLLFLFIQYLLGKHH